MLASGESFAMEALLMFGSCFEKEEVEFPSMAHLRPKLSCSYP
jgi:hypothetical protein